MVRIAGCGERWDRIGVIAPDNWKGAVQAVARGTQLVSPSGESLVWLDEPCALALHQSSPQRRLALRVRAYTLVLLDADDQLVKTFPLDGATATEAAAWIAKQGSSNDAEVDLPAAPNPDVLVHIDRTLSNVHHTLARVGRVTHGASAPRTNPVTLETWARIALASREGESARFIDLGLSPSGDQGYLYVRAEPPADEPDEPSDWRFPVSSIAAMSDVDAQATTVEQFLGESLEKAYARLRRQWRSRRPSGAA